MQAIYRFSEDYIEPVSNHEATQFVFQLGTEVVKIIAAKIFLEYVGNHYLNDPKKISKHDVHTTTVLAPLYEELFFRFGVLKGIYLIQKALDNKGIQLASTLFGPSHDEMKQDLQEDEGDDQTKKKDESPIIIYPPLVDEMLCRGYITSLYLIRTMINAIFNRIHVSSAICSNESAEPDGFALQFTPPFEQDVIYQIFKKGVSLIELPDEEEVTEEEKVKQVFRIHLAALIFAAAHLSNPHPNKSSALLQFSWTFIGGIIYGYLSEKYQSLAPGIIAHGINNSIAVAVQIYSQDIAPFLFAAIIANRVITYLIATTQIDKIIALGASQAANAYYSFPERLFNWKKQQMSDDQISVEESIV